MYRSITLCCGDQVQNTDFFQITGTKESSEMAVKKNRAVLANFRKAKEQRKPKAF